MAQQGQIKASDFQRTVGDILDTKTHTAKNGMQKISKLEVVGAGSPTDATREKNGMPEVRTKYPVYAPTSKRNFTLTVPGAPVSGFQFGSRFIAFEVFGGVAGNTVWINADSLVAKPKASKE